MNDGTFSEKEVKQLKSLISANSNKFVNDAFNRIRERNKSLKEDKNINKEK